MVKQVITVRPDDEIDHAMRLMLDNEISGLPVVDENDGLVGVLAERDCIASVVRAAADDAPTARVREVMSTELHTAGEGDHFLTMAHVFITKPIRRLPVVRDGKLVGLVARRDLMRCALEVFDEAPDRKAAYLYLSALEREPPQL
jgi:CBS domain-containing protein